VAGDKSELGKAREAPLKGLIVLDATIAYAGPLASLLLVGLGATVIKVENPQGGDMARTNPPYIGTHTIKLTPDDTEDISIPFTNRSRGKLSVAIDLKVESGCALYMDLVRISDVITENFSSGVADRLGIGYSDVQQVNPQIVYCCQTGFGKDTPPRESRAMDIMIQALSGVMEATGDPGEPPIRQGLPVGDLFAPMFAVIGVLAALQRRNRTGLGDLVDISMLDVLTSLVAGEHFDALSGCGIPIRTGNSLARMAPFGVFPTVDGYVAIAGSTDAFAWNLGRAMNWPGITEEARFATRDLRTANRADLDCLIAAWTSRMTTSNVMQRLQECDVPAAPVRGPIAAIQDERVLRRHAVVPLRHPTYPDSPAVAGFGMPISFGSAEVGFEGLIPPRLGEHTELVLKHFLGYDQAKIDDLRNEKVIL